jgi:hypothetical protein
MVASHIVGLLYDTALGEENRIRVRKIFRRGKKVHAPITCGADNEKNFRRSKAAVASRRRLVKICKLMFQIFTSNIYKRPNRHH